MATKADQNIATKHTIPEQGTVRRAKAGSTLRYDWAVAIASLLVCGGSYLDSWAHLHGKVDQTFFTPWHAILYSGFVLCAVIIVGAVIENLYRGYPFNKAIPRGYRLSVIAVPLFAVAGVGDLIWHTLFGFEVDLEAFLSPTHLLLASAAILIVTGPLRAAWQRIPADRESASLRSLLPAILSATMLLATFIFLQQYNHPLNFLFAQQNSRFGDSLGLGVSILGIILASTFLMAIVLMMLRRWRLPFGTMTIILTISSLLIVTQRDHYYLMPIPILTGLISDFLMVRWRPSPQRLLAVRWFAISVPAVFYALYFGELSLTIGVGWTIHLWAGTIFICAAVSLMLSYAIMPPAPVTDNDSID